MTSFQKGNDEIRKPEILETYYQVFIKEGFEGASIGKIAKRIDIHPSQIVHQIVTNAVAVMIGPICGALYC